MTKRSWHSSFKVDDTSATIEEEAAAASLASTQALMMTLFRLHEATSLPWEVTVSGERRSLRVKMFPELPLWMMLAAKPFVSFFYFDPNMYLEVEAFKLLVPVQLDTSSCHPSFMAFSDSDLTPAVFVHNARRLRQHVGEEPLKATPLLNELQELVLDYLSVNPLTLERLLSSKK